VQRINRLTQRQCETAMPTEIFDPKITERTLRFVEKTPPGWSRAEKLVKGAARAVRDGKPVIIKRRTKWLPDGMGLWLIVSPGEEPDSARRSWIFRWTAPGQTVVSKSGKARRLQRRIGLGSLLTVNLQRARELADLCRRHLQEGRDPLLVKRGRSAEAKVAERRLKTLAAAVDEYLHAHSQGWSRKHALVWRRSFDHLQSILDLPVSQMDRSLVVSALKPLWQSNPETARRLRGRLEKVLAKATADGWRTGENPAQWRGSLEFSFRPRSHLQPVKHHDALPYPDAPAFMQELRRIDGVKARALELLILTAVRTGEIISARREEFDLDAIDPTWTVPPEKTKTGKRTGKPHIVPLSEQAVACLRKSEIVPGRLVFPTHNRALWRLTKRIRNDVSVHGFRSTFSTWASEMTDYPTEVREAALDHLVGNDVERAYRRTSWLDKRRALLRDWSDWCDGKVETADNVVAMRA
jgi:integrase